MDASFDPVRIANLTKTASFCQTQEAYEHCGRCLLSLRQLMRATDLLTLSFTLGAT